MRRRRVALLLLAAVIVALAAGGVIVVGRPAPWQAQEEPELIAGQREPDGVPVNLDASLYLPRHTPAPAVLLAHGFGGTKESMAADAQDLADRGFAVLTWSARGFGRSGGKVHLDAPGYEVKDARLLIDWLSRQPEVLQDGRGDPRVGIVGASYGGALALLTAGHDRRVDAVAPSITWNDLRQALFPQYATDARAGPRSPADVRPTGGPGVFKKQWTALLAGQAVASPRPADGTATAFPVPSGTAARARLGVQALAGACGRLDPQLCLEYVRTATTGRPSAALLKLLEASSPARVNANITVPVLLVQGQADSLVPLSEGDANARQVRGPVTVVWEGGGHDGGLDEADRLRTLTGDFLHSVLVGNGTGVPSRAFQVTVPDAVVSSVDSNPVPQVRAAGAEPGLRTAPALRTDSLPLRGAAQTIISPPGATPAALTSLPGLGSTLGLLSGAASSLRGGPESESRSGDSSGGSTGPAAGALGAGVLPGQAASFDTAPLPAPRTLVGAGRVTVQVASTAANATLFASLQDVAPDGTATLPEQLVSPVYLNAVPAAGQTVTIALPAVVRDVPAGHRLRVVVSSTDQAYSVPNDVRGYRISLAAGSALTLPAVELDVTGGGGSRVLAASAAVLVLLLLAALAAALVARGRRRRLLAAADPELAGVPLAVEGVGKTFGDGFRAVSDLTLRVERGQVLGLLGPNGAGKTTALRMVIGLIRPTEGDVRIFGHPVVQGAPVLSRVGVFVEGPGFLPHLSGRDNLRLYWQATGRPEAEARLDVALEVAGLDADLDRRVRTYSHGMKQRLGIAQAMLGLPELLVLDEPTNGLDPPQIREMREVLTRYAATGRTVVVSSHLLGEVEQTCSHVAVMAGGRLLTAGPVAQLVGAATVLQVDVDDPARAARLARVVEGVHDVEEVPAGLMLRAGPGPRAILVRTLVMAGVGVDRIAPRHGLEETFLSLVSEPDAGAAGGDRGGAAGSGAGGASSGAGSGDGSGNGAAGGRRPEPVGPEGRADA